jgi:hypothetical protein
MSREDRPHPILPNASFYRIVGLTYGRDEWKTVPEFLELQLLGRDGDRRVFRFRNPRELIVTRGFPGIHSGLQILDVSGAQWDGIHVRVTGSEQDFPVHFYAADVIDMTPNDMLPPAT